VKSEKCWNGWKGGMIGKVERWKGGKVEWLERWNDGMME